MKKALVILNLVLLLGVAWGFFSNLKRMPAFMAKDLNKKATRSAVGAAAKTKGKSAKTVKGQRGTASKNLVDPAAQTPQLPEIGKAAKMVADIDVFNNVRSPLANSRNGRIELTLLGTFKAGNTEGAIIRQRGIQRQINPYLQMMMRAGGMGPGGGMPPPPGGGMPPPDRGGSGGPRGGGRGFTNWSSFGRNGSGNQAQTSFKQYVRIGETLSNGYTLTEITRTTATLVRGNDKMELELQDPSKNRTATRNSGPRKLNTNQQFQQAQMIMQSQMMRTMMQMQRNQNGGGGGNAAPRGRR